MFVCLCVFACECFFRVCMCSAISCVILYGLFVVCYFPLCCACVCLCVFGDVDLIHVCGFVADVMFCVYCAWFALRSGMSRSLFHCVFVCA